MDYKEAIEYINHIDRFGSNTSFKSVERLLELVGNPHKNLNFIHIGGTNGKGSTSSFINSILIEAGYKVGMFTSPYIEVFNERIKLNGKNIPDKDLVRLTGIVKEAMRVIKLEGIPEPKTFEIVTVLGFMYFMEKEVDLVVLEVGIGGRYDTTNIIDKSLVSVLTKIDYDHMDILGNSLEEIAYNKVGILKENGLLITKDQEKSVEKVFCREVEEKRASMEIVGKSTFKIKSADENGSVFDFTYGNFKYRDLKISLMGLYQVENCVLGIYTVLKLRDMGIISILENQIRQGILKNLLPARMELIHKEPMVIIDGSHNLEGIRNLLSNLAYIDYRELIICTSILKGKDMSHMVEGLFPYGDEIIITETSMARRYLAEDIYEAGRDYNSNIKIEKDYKKAYELAINNRQTKDLILFVGSLYFAGDIRKLYKKA